MLLVLFCFVHPLFVCVFSVVEFVFSVISDRFLAFALPWIFFF
jgi:hypothetical protein